jgi:hypothetical protein
MSDMMRPSRAHLTLRQARREASGVHEPALAREVAHALLELLEGAHLDLADALARDVVARRQVLEGDDLFAEAAAARARRVRGP